MRAPGSHSDPADDLALLRAHEPILHFTEGELFFPMSTSPYVAECDLLSGPSPREARVMIPHGELDLDRLGSLPEARPGEARFLRFVQRPLDPVELGRWSQRPDRPRFQAPGRLARVGLAARLLDAGSSISLLLRGRVPGGTAAAASMKYASIRVADPRVCYHGRVVRADGWIVLHYLFFYAMNDWRSTFNGANDHEADWEQVFVVLEDAPDGSPRPVWFAAAAHDEKGDDLRRRWDDPRFAHIAGHPVIYPGAGSHASYLEQGEYIMRLPLPGEAGLHGFLDALRGFWRDVLGQPDPGDIAASVQRALSVPFVDYARGDGLAVGPGQSVEWTPIVIGDDVPWVDRYRGLWGLDTGDRLAGERAPAGPKYTRTGTVRQSWNDPLGFAGLAKVAPPGRAAAVMADRITELRAELESVEAEAATLAARLPGFDLEVRALSLAEGSAGYREARREELAAGEARLVALRTQRSELQAAIAASEARLASIAAGDEDPPRAHLRHAAEPEPPDLRRRRVIADTWAAVSVGLVVIAFAAILAVRLLPPWTALVAVLAAYIGIEAFLRRGAQELLLRVVILLAIVATLILAWEFSREIILLGLVLLGLLIIVDNLRELQRR